MAVGAARRGGHGCHANPMPDVVWDLAVVAGGQARLLEHMMERERRNEEEEN